MVDRFVLWLGAGAVCAGVAVGMLAGAGVAHANTESDGDGGAKTSQSAKTAENKPDSGQGDAGNKHRQKQNVNVVKTDKHTDKDTAAKADADVDKVGADTDTAKDVARDGVRSEAGKRTAKLITNFVAAVTHKPDRKVVAAKADPVEAADPVDTAEAVDTDPIASVTNLVSRRTAGPSAFSPTRSNVTLATPTLARSQVAETASAPPIKVPPVVSAIGTAVFGLLSFAESVFEGPPKALPGSGVTVKRSTLAIGDQEVPADWYFPEGYDPNSDTPPERIIYLQHGFLARGVFYDYTASYLAKETNSVVVAPSITSNIFATDGMWLGGDQMHRAAADLFNNDNTALLDSAHDAGYTQDLLPQNVVLIGHSLGGGFVIDTARYMLENQENGDSTHYHLAGVLMLDGVSFTDPVPILEQLDGVPVYNLSATPYVWNMFGTMDAALAQVRGDDFHGAQLLGGLHSDSMIGGNPLVQFGAYLATGFSLPSNAAGSQVLAAGWINDMFAGTETCDDTSCFYADPGQTITVPSAFGPAIGLVQPKPGVIDSIARELTAVVFRLVGKIDFATDVPDTEETGVLQEISA
jgi:pimeloyl-ACP methyl ester carboxylesterase